MNWSGLGTNHRAIIILFAVALIIVVILIGYQYPVTGFGEATFIVSPISPLSPIVQYRPAKTLWDWIDLFAASIALAIGAALYRWVTREKEKQANDERAAAELEQYEQQRIASDRAGESAMQIYFVRIGDMLLKVRFACI